ncbi:hypothetical protein [Sulfolobus spindle-shaped virus 6]|uniref:Uncharacterized protein n=1 Tax=Sulfolobus spindle-shaped virus 6 TaxID=693627 RepID=D1GF39_9VIRU|nr:hypothetical protein SSSV6_gp21 [Sulfolobus spindle-shaped virus 6]ACZ35740.1 hypothetical protein [Sulfolobus spindle-shaped virus 6]
MAKTLHELIDDFFKSQDKQLVIYFAEKVEVDEAEFKELVGNYVPIDFVVTGKVNVDLYYIINKGYVEIGYIKKEQGKYQLLSIHAYKECEQQ